MKQNLGHRFKANWKAETNCDMMADKTKWPSINREQRRLSHNMISASAVAETMTESNGMTAQLYLICLY
jgi:ribonucleotide reductase beta subunit family protein with ferritin-like domain